MWLRFRQNYVLQMLKITPVWFYHNNLFILSIYRQWLNDHQCQTFFSNYQLSWYFVSKFLNISRYFFHLRHLPYVILPITITQLIWILSEWYWRYLQKYEGRQRRSKAKDFNPNNFSVRQCNLDEIIKSL